MKRWLLLAFLASCAAASKPAPATAPAMAPVPSRDPRAEIERLSGEIDRATQQQTNPTPGVHPMAAGAQAPAAPFTATDPTCKPAPTDACTDSCTLASSICDNAKKICDLAKDLEGDSWAADKCSSANKSCDSARGKCCGCQ